MVLDLPTAPRLMITMRSITEEGVASRTEERKEIPTVKTTTDDALITLVKHEKKGYDSRIQDLEACREEMMSLANVMGRRISSRKRRVCGELAEEAQNVA